VPSRRMTFARSSNREPWPSAGVPAPSRKGHSTASLP